MGRGDSPTFSAKEVQEALRGLKIADIEAIRRNKGDIECAEEDGMESSYGFRLKISRLLGLYCSLNRGS